MFSHKFKDFVTSVLYHPTLSEVLLCGTSSSGIFAIDAKTGKVIFDFLIQQIKPFTIIIFFFMDSSQELYLIKI